MRKALLCLFACLLAAGAAMAQNAAPPAQKQKVIPAGTIDGKQHPEQIPDLMAFRLFFIQAAGPAQPTLNDARKQGAKLDYIGLSGANRVVLIGELVKFRGGYAAFLTKYKNTPIGSTTLSERDAITQRTMDDLRASMSALGWQQFNAFIQREKIHMRRVPMPDMSMK